MSEQLLKVVACNNVNQLWRVHVQRQQQHCLVSYLRVTLQQISSCMLVKLDNDAQGIANGSQFHQRMNVD